MTMRTKTVEYAWGVFAGTTTDSAYNSLGAITVAIPETTSRTILAAWVEVESANAGSGGINTVTGFNARMTVGAAAAQANTTAPSWTNPSYGAYWFSLAFDFTTYFQTNFAGTSKSVTLEVYTSETGAGIKGLVYPSARLFITYQYDDATEATLLKTVRIPLCATPMSSTAAGTTLGSVIKSANLLPEANVVIQQAFVEVDWHDARNGTAGAQAFFQIGAQASNPINYCYGDYNVPRTGRSLVLWPTTGWASSVAFKISATSPAQFRCAAVLVVTYTFTPAGTTRVLNSYMLAAHDANWAAPQNSATQTDTNYKDKLTLNWVIQEPIPSVMRPTGVKVLTPLDPDSGNSYYAWQTGAAPAVTAYGGFKISANSNRNTGPVVNMSTWDASTPVGVSNARGPMTIDLGYWCYRYDSAFRVGAHQFVVYINYESNLSAQGHDAHAHTVLFPVLGLTFQNDPATGSNPTANVTPLDGAVLPALAEPNYYASGTFVRGAMLWNGNTTASTPAVMSAGAKRSAANGGGYVGKQLAFVQSAAFQCMWFNLDTTSLFVQNPAGASVDSRIAINETGMKFRIIPPTTDKIAAWMVFGITYHAITSTVAGTVTGFTGDGSGITVRLHDSTTGNVLQTTTTAVGGGYSFTHYETIRNLFTSAAQDATHLGRSADGTAS